MTTVSLQLLPSWTAMALDLLIRLDATMLNLETWIPGRTRAAGHSHMTSSRQCLETTVWWLS
jgi:hypothetical protein